MDRSDPSGNVDLIEVTETANYSIGLGIAASGVLYQTISQGHRQNGGLCSTATVEKAQTDARKQVEQVEQQCNCKSVVFHYADLVNAVLILCRTR